MNSRAIRRAIAPWFAASTLAASAAASSTETTPRPTDGVYGRFDGDLDLSIAAGGVFTSGASGGSAIARAMFLETAGAYVAYADAFRTGTPTPPRSLSLGVGVRPFFIPRWALNMQHGPALLDLTIDAITLDLGVLWTADERGHFTTAPGMELGLGTEIPLAGTAAGPWIGVRGAVRWSAAELAGARDDDQSLSPNLFVTFGWHFLASTHLVDFGDAVLR